MMNLISKVLETYREDGLVPLLKKSKRYLLHRIYQKPTVTDGSTHPLLWLLKPFYNLFFMLKHGTGVDVMSEDWDTLILLDACRYDDFRELNTLDGDLEDRISKGVDSSQFIKKNFVGRDLSDTVYVTANPHVKLVKGDVFHDVITDPLSSWDSALRCVPPNEVTKAAINAHQEYPNKRIVVHYMQPHDPPLGPTADALRSELQIDGPMDTGAEDGERIMELVAEGRLSEERARLAYRETLKIVLAEADILSNEISGKVVISSDHGEMFGERPYLLLGRLYEHYRNPRTQELCRVPWFIVDADSERRRIISEPSRNNNKPIDDVNVDEQLSALGYK